MSRIGRITQLHIVVERSLTHFPMGHTIMYNDNLKSLERHLIPTPPICMELMSWRSSIQRTKIYLPSPYLFIGFSDDLIYCSQKRSMAL